MGTGEFFLASLAGVFFGTVALALAMFAFHRIGFGLGRRAKPRRPVWQGIVAIAFVCWPVSFWPFLTDWDRFIDAGVSLAFYATMAFPMTMGYAAAREMRYRQDRRRWRKNADDWLGDWECEHAPVSLDDAEQE